MKEMTLAGRFSAGAARVLQRGWGLWRGFWQLSWHLRLYLAAVALLLASLALGAYLESRWMLETVAPLPLLGFPVGFLCWFVPRFRRWQRREVGRLTLVLGSVVAGVLALVPAQYMVARTLGLPPHDFPATVAIWAVLSIPLAWMPLAACAAAGFYLVFNLRLVIGLVFGAPWLERLEAFGHVVGVSTVLGAITLLMTGLVSESHVGPLVRHTAYLADYQCLWNMPGIDKGHPARIHANGIVSYALREGLSVRIVVDGEQGQRIAKNGRARC